MIDAPVLGSYHYWRKADLAAAVHTARQQGVHVDFFADSGAFSAANTGDAINLRDYTAWLADHAPLINFAAGLDVIGDAAATRRNTAALEDAIGDRVVILPTFHVGSKWAELERMCAAHRFVALGGAVAFIHRERAMLAWLTKCHRIGREHGTVFHGFGLTRPPVPSSLPWYSVDSSYWTSAQRTGGLSLFDTRSEQFVKFRVGTGRAAQHAAIIRSYGMDPTRATLHGFGRVGLRGAAGKAEWEWLGAASAESWRRYADWWRRRRPPVPAPPRVRGDGPKVYLASGCSDLTRLIRAYAHHAHQAVPA